MDKVLKKRADTEGVPSANPKVSVAKITVEKTKLSRIASAKETAKNQNATMRKGFKRKFKEHYISVDSIKRYKSTTGHLGNPRDTTMVEPTSYQNLGVKGDWSDIVMNCPITQQSLDVKAWHSHHSFFRRWGHPAAHHQNSDLRS